VRTRFIKKQKHNSNKINLHIFFLDKLNNTLSAQT